MKLLRLARSILKDIEWEFTFIPEIFECFGEKYLF